MYSSSAVWRRSTSPTEGDPCCASFLLVFKHLSGGSPLEPRTSRIIRLSLGETSATKQHIACLLIEDYDRTSEILPHLHRPLDRRARLYTLVPAPKVRVLRQTPPLPLVGRRPRADGHVRDGIPLAGKVGSFGEACVHDPVQSCSLVGIAIYGVGELFRGVPSEVVGLAEHGSHVGHLKHQPLQGDVLLAGGGWPKLASLLGKVNHNCSRLEHGNRLPVWALRVYDGRHLVVGAYPEELLVELLPCGDIDGYQVIRQPRLFQKDGDLLAVGGWPIIKVDRLRHSSSLLIRYFDYLSMYPASRSAPLAPLVSRARKRSRGVFAFWNRHSCVGHPLRQPHEGPLPPGL